MNKAPDGAVMDESSSDEETVPLLGGAEKEVERFGDPNPNPNPAGGAGAHPHRECPPRASGPIDELTAALREATLGPVHPRHHGLDPLPNEDRRRPKVKIQLPVFKGLPGERPDAHLLATSDWMEVM